MSKYDEINPEAPKKCPKCFESAEEDIYGQPMTILIEDDHMPCKWVLLRGWVCEDLIFGTCVRRGPTDNETEPQDMLSHGHSYLMNLPGRKWHIS